MSNRNLLGTGEISRWDLSIQRIAEKVGLPGSENVLEARKEPLALPLESRCWYCANTRKNSLCPLSFCHLFLMHILLAKSGHMTVSWLPEERETRCLDFAAFSQQWKKRSPKTCRGSIFPQLRMVIQCLAVKITKVIMSQDALYTTLQRL